MKPHTSANYRTVILVRSRAIDPSIHKVAEALAKNNYDVKLLVWDRKGERRFEKFNGYNVRYFSIKAPYDKVNVAFYLPLWWLYEFLVLLLNDAKIIHACDLDTLMPAITIKLIKKVKLCYTIYDFYADNLPKLFPSFARKIIAWVEKFGIGLCDAIFIVDPTRYRQIKGARMKRMAVIYNSPPDYVEGRLVSKPSVTKEVTLFYAGLIDRSRGLTDILKTVRDLDEVKLVIAGLGPDVKIFENLPRSLKYKVEYVGFIPYKEVVKRTLEADILFALYDPTIPNNIYASPNKLFEAMMCGKPIIVNEETTAAEIVKKERCGLVIPYGNVEAIKNAVMRLKNDCSLRLMLGKNGRLAYEKIYNWKLMKRRLLHIYDQLISHTGEEA
ncbi:glycosyltransferase WbuB [Candidatus Bathyarchaeota archaeon]|nr:MAG: glycosyltransferase WbuB [Candidatus Bathyarchaeota archaeon]